MYKLIKNYQNDDKLRSSLNKLAEKTFKLNFENWYKSGYWRNNYIPLLASGEIDHFESGENSQFQSDRKSQYTSFSFL